jgi:soluble lytic murein transglycosylase-like protein
MKIRIFTSLVVSFFTILGYLPPSKAYQLSGEKFFEHIIEKIANQERIPVRLLKAIVEVESNYNPLAIGVNKKKTGYSLFPKTKQEARYLIEKLEHQGVNFDVGLAQVNIRNIKKMGVPTDLIFNPEVNLTLGARILKSLIKHYGLTWEAVWRYNGSKRYAYKVYDALIK